MRPQRQPTHQQHFWCSKVSAVRQRSGMVPLSYRSPCECRQDWRLEPEDHKWPIALRKLVNLGQRQHCDNRYLQRCFSNRGMLVESSFLWPAPSSFRIRLIWMCFVCSLAKQYTALKWKDAISAFPFSQGSAEPLDRWGEKTKHNLISYFLSITSSKNYCNWIVYVKIIVSRRWDDFFRQCISAESLHSVITYSF